jgi:glycerate kinase
VAIFAGRVAPDASVLLGHGVERLIAITADGTPLEQALREGAQSLARATADFCREVAG